MTNRLPNAKATYEIFEKINIKLSRGEICVTNFTPPANGVSLGSFLVQNLTSAWKHCLNKPISPFFEEANMVKRAEKYVQGYVVCGFLNLLPPYSLHSQGDKTLTLWVAKC